MKQILILSLIVMATGLEEARFTLSTTGKQFQTANQIELLATFSNTHSAASCGMHCFHNSLCRTFDFDSNSQQCRLFEGSIDTGTLLSTSSLSSAVGWIDIPSLAYNMYNASSDQCVNNRFLVSDISSGLCQCPIHTFWNRSMCLNQRYAGETCQSNNWCRTDLNINCSLLVCFANDTFSSTTTTTTSTTTTATSIATVAPPCTSQASSNGILYNITNPTSYIFPNYTCHAYTWVATGSTATLSFFFRHDPGAWMLDAVNVYHGLTQLITNGGFESGSLSGWSYSGTCNWYNGQAYSGSSSAKSGNYYYYDPCALYGDTISQSFATTIGDTYVISFG